MTALYPRPPIERYLRVIVPIPGGEIEVGLAYFPHDALNDLRAQARLQVDEVTAAVRAHVPPIPLTVDLAAALTGRLEVALLTRFVDRPFWIEVWDDREALTQTYAPWGRPCFTGSDVGACCGGVGGTEFKMRAPCEHYPVDASPVHASYRECAACASKPGAPQLCAACLHNRALVEALQVTVKQLNAGPQPAPTLAADLLGVLASWRGKQATDAELRAAIDRYPNLGDPTQAKTCQQRDGHRKDGASGFECGELATFVHRNPGGITGPFRVCNRHAAIHRAHDDGRMLEPIAVTSGPDPDMPLADRVAQSYFRALRLYTDELAKLREVFRVADDLVASWERRGRDDGDTQALTDAVRAARPKATP